MCRWRGRGRERSSVHHGKSPSSLYLWQHRECAYPDYSFIKEESLKPTVEQREGVPPNTQSCKYLSETSQTASISSRITAINIERPSSQTQQQSQRYRGTALLVPARMGVKGNEQPNKLAKKSLKVGFKTTK